VDLVQDYLEVVVVVVRKEPLSSPKELIVDIVEVPVEVDIMVDWGPIWVVVEVVRVTVLDRFSMIYKVYKWDMVKWRFVFVHLMR